MSGFNFFSHGSQDLYPVYLQTTKKFSSFDASKATIISNVGAIIGKSKNLRHRVQRLTIRWYDCGIRFPICRSTSSVSPSAWLRLTTGSSFACATPLAGSPSGSFLAHSADWQLVDSSFSPEFRVLGVWFPSISVKSPLLRSEHPLEDWHTN